MQPGYLIIMKMQKFDYTSTRWKRTRERALRRDGYMCQECRKYGKAAQATVVHHKKHVDEYPELAYDLGNLESLCTACHDKAHPEKGRKALKARYGK